MPNTKGSITVALLIVVAALLLVGVVSQTVIRHAIQVAPAVLIVALRPGRRAWAGCAATAVFTFWLVIMSLIWLYLLGLARVVTGQFTPTEVALTLVIGGASLAGLIAACRARDLPPWRLRVAAFVLAGAVQVGATWLSVQPLFATR